MPMTTKILRTSDEIDAEYERTAPLKDLQFYLRYGERLLTDFALSDETITILCEMAYLEAELAALDDTHTHKRRVWALIDRFKTSIPGWAGNAGAKDGWLDPVDHPATYWRARTFFLQLEPADETEEPPIAAGPISQSALKGWHDGESERLKHAAFRVQRRPQAMEPDVAKAVIKPAAATAPANERAKPSKAKRPETLVLACPKCSTPLVPIAGVAHTWGCAPCQETWYLAPAAQREQQAEQPKPKRAELPKRASAPRAVPAAVTEAGQRQCRECQSWHDVAEFYRGGAMRSRCKACERARQRAARHAA